MSPGTSNGLAHSLILATDYRVPDPGRVWPLLQRRKQELADLGAHHVLVHLSATDADRVLVTMALSGREPVVELLRSRVFFDWFDEVGVEDLPAVFAGEQVERFDAADSAGPRPPGVVVSGVTVVEDPDALFGYVRRNLDYFRGAGVRRMWIFRAFDDPCEVMFMQELADEASAERWLQRPETAAQWLHDAGVGPYPPVFIGRLAHLMRIDEADGTDDL